MALTHKDKGEIIASKRVKNMCKIVDRVDN